MTCKILDTPGDKSSPAGLMRGSQSPPVVAVKVFVKEDKVLPVRVRTVQPAASVAGPFPGSIGKEEFGQTTRKLAGHLIKIHADAGPRRTLYGERIAVKVVVALKRFEQKVIDGEPDGTTPIGVPPNIQDGESPAEYSTE